MFCMQIMLNDSVQSEAAPAEQHESDMECLEVKVLGLEERLSEKEVCQWY